MRWRSFAQQASELSVPLTQEQIDRFRRYTDLLLNANRRINLTALRDEASLMTKFYLDALGLLPVIARYAGLSPDQLRI